MEDNEAVVDGLVPHVNWASDSDGEEDRKDTEITCRLQRLHGFVLDLLFQ